MRNFRTTAALTGMAAIVAACGMSGAPAQATAGCPAPIAVAHRGESSLAPEESGPAMAAAVKAGAKVVEMDIRFTKNNVAVLVHDPKVDRTTNGTGYVSSYYYGDIIKLDSGSKFSSAYAGTRIITLGAALRLMSATPGVLAIPELKGSLTDSQLSIVANAVQSSTNGMAGRVVIQSFTPSILQRFHKIAPKVPLALTTDADPADPVTALKAAYATHWLPRSTNLTAEHLASAKAAGIKVWTWTVNTPAEWDRLTTMGVGGILTDKPAQYAGWATARCGVAP